MNQKDLAPIVANSLLIASLKQAGKYLDDVDAGRVKHVNPNLYQDLANHARTHLELLWGTPEFHTLADTYDSLSEIVENIQFQRNYG
jgi:hypothetical protein